MSLRRVIYVAITVICLYRTEVYSQVNAYAQVTGISGNVLTLGTVNETFDTFEDGELLIIMQMQDDVIGSNTSNNTSFGNLSAIGSAGLYEVRAISSHTESAGVPTSVTITSPLGNIYVTGASSSVQIISFPTLGGGGNYTTTANIIPVDWNGTIGGVIAFEVGGTLTLNHNITANNNGFRGGSVSGNYYSNSSGDCHTTIYTTSSTNYGYKGEGIYRTANTAYRNGRAKILNGGGGGGHINAGGGGGGNYTAGGNGGAGWSCAATPASGLGGIALSAVASASRIFMGGGGGGGQQNNSASTNGGDGGGIILIKANQIQTTGSCGAGRIISANGQTPANCGNDGGGGGGAGGTIVFEVNSWSLVAPCPLTISANGGGGSNVNNATVHAGGGGGGQGSIIFSGTAPSTNVTIQSNNGAGGCDNTGCSSAGVSGSGSNNQGVIAGAGGPLPITLSHFSAALSENQVLVKWVTATEINNAYFEVERSPEGSAWSPISKIPGAGNSRVELSYSAIDQHPIPGENYYRLKQVDYDGNFSYSNVEIVYMEWAYREVKLYPNPFDEILIIEAKNLANAEVVVFNASGQQVRPEIEYDGSIIRLDFANLNRGLYLVKITSGGKLLKSAKVLKDGNP